MAKKFSSTMSQKEMVAYVSGPKVAYNEMLCIFSQVSPEIAKVLKKAWLVASAERYVTPIFESCKDAPQSVIDAQIKNVALSGPLCKKLFLAKIAAYPSSK